MLEQSHVGGVNEYPQSMFSVICKRRFHITRSRSFAHTIYYLDCNPATILIPIKIYKESTMA